MLIRFRPSSSLRRLSSGIGLAAAKLLASRGLRLALCDINLPQLEAAQKELIGVAAASSLERGGTTGEGAGNVIVKQVDVSNVEEVEAWKESVISTWGEVCRAFVDRWIDGSMG
jgi:NAD(P)-dependent dehydrogenase (short-subunit alcohol dehydrogenase family)